jgi:hypothetical protein
MFATILAAVLLLGMATAVAFRAEVLGLGHGYRSRLRSIPQGPGPICGRWADVTAVPSG